jgi:hypothetical protein
MLRFSLLVFALTLAGCQSPAVKVPSKDLQGLEKFTLPVTANNTEAVVYVVHLQDGEVEPKKVPEYRWVRNVQIGDTERRSSAPGEHMIFKMKPGTYKIKVTGICGRDNNTVMPAKGSEITPEMPGWKTQTTFFGSALTGNADDVILEPGKTYIYSMSPVCYFNRQAGDLVFLLGMRLRNDLNARYLVYKTKLAGK